MEKRQNEVIEIDLLELFYALKKQILWIILVAIVGGTLAFAGTKLLMTPMYESTTTMLVLTKETTLSSLADLQMGTQLTNDYEILTVSRQVLERVIDDLNLDMEYEDLKKSVQISNPSDSRIMEISVTYTSPKLAKEIVDELKPRVVIPMHYRGEGFGYDVLAPLDDYLSLVDGPIVRYPGNSMELTAETFAQTAVLACPL